MPGTPGTRRLNPRGSPQAGPRRPNERLILQAIRLHGALPGADLARLTRLTAQTVSLTTKRLLDEGLLVKGAPRRGQVGQPSVPLALNPDGAYAIGVHLGRRRLDLLLVDFEGAVRERSTCAFEFPDPARVMAEIVAGVQGLMRRLGHGGVRARLQGIGIAAPLRMDGWRSLLGMAPAVAEDWARTDLRREVERQTGLDTALLKDTAAACVAELVAGRGRSLPSFLYVFVDTFVGGGLVIDSHLHAGLHGNAGAIGSLPLGLAAPDGGAAAPPQLLGTASLLALENRFRVAHLEPAAAYDERALQTPWWPHAQAWLDEAGTAIALAVHGAACLLDLDGAILDGNLPRAVLDALHQAVDRALARYPWEGVARPALVPGAVGPDARAIGGALLPLYARFAPDRSLFLKAADG